MGRSALVDALVAALWRLAVALLDRQLDAQIDRLKDGDMRDTLRRVEDYVIAFLTGPLGVKLAQEIARPLALRAAARWFPNRPDTGTWG
jgi:hypothetical protein